MSEETTKFCLDVAKAAKQHGTVISFDLNHRATFWKGREEELAAAFQMTPEGVSDVYYLLGAAYDSKNLNAEAIAAYKQVTAGDKLEVATARAKELDEFIKAEAAAKK